MCIAVTLGETRHEDRSHRHIRRRAPLAVRAGAHGRWGRGLGRGESGRARRSGSGRVRGVEGPLPRRRSFSHRGHLADRLSRRFLSRRAGGHVGGLGARPGSVGPQGQGPGRAGLAADRRQGARPGRGLWLDRRRPAARGGGRGQGPARAGLPQGQDERHRGSRLAGQPQGAGCDAQARGGGA